MSAAGRDMTAEELESLVLTLRNRLMALESEVWALKQKLGLGKPWPREQSAEQGVLPLEVLS